jgi:hypothetical protein
MPLRLIKLFNRLAALELIIFAGRDSRDRFLKNGVEA